MSGGEKLLAAAFVVALVALLAARILLAVLG